jgi:hypothetical protein
MNMNLKHFSLLALFCSLALAASPAMAEKQNECADPAMAHAAANQQEDLSSLTPEERDWYKTFQEGTFLFSGWKEISEKILKSTPAELREHQRKRLEQLGRKIGMEWSRENAVRRVDNKMLKEWGDELKKTARTNPEQLPEVIASIDEQLNSILN